MFSNGAMTSNSSGQYDSALDRFHRTGPEFDGRLSNHGPMVVEAMSRRGSVSEIHRWTDRYQRRLLDVPESRRPIGSSPEEVRVALGDLDRLGDWPVYFRNVLTEQSWTVVLAEWWPRLVPGIAAGATHGVIRTGHIVQELQIEETPTRINELAQALGYWAARWQVTPQATPGGSQRASQLVVDVPRVAWQVGGIRERFTQLIQTPGWLPHVDRHRPVSADEVPDALDDLVDGVVLAYPQICLGSPTMLVHAATAPRAVARLLLSLPRSEWVTAYQYTWAASAAVLAAYLPAEVVKHPSREVTDAWDAWEQAVNTGGEHVIKFADTALDTYERTEDPRALQAVGAAIEHEA